MILTIIGWIFGWSLRLFHHMTHNYVVAMVLFLLVSRALYSLWEAYQNKCSARQMLCSKMLDKCQKELAPLNTDAYMECGEKIYKITKTNVFSGMINGIVSIFLMMVFIQALTNPITYYFGAKPADVGFEAEASQVEIFETENVERKGDTQLAKEMQSESIFIGNHSVFDPVTVNDWTVVIPILILTLQLSVVVRAVKSAFNHEYSVGKRIGSVGLPILVSLMLLTSVFVLPLYIGLEFIVFRVGSILFEIIFKKTAAPKYNLVLENMRKQCEQLIQTAIENNNEKAPRGNVE